jgi:D-arabinose 1-dehydrogenase-like Zn-dependent alcohol dehydrogenase
VSRLPHSVPERWLGVLHPIIETLPLIETNAAYEQMVSGKARCRMVLTTAP